MSAFKENTTILLEILKYFGRDANVVEMFDKFKEVHRADKQWMKGVSMSKDDLNRELKDMFEDALHQLKYSGFLSATRQSMFLFKKNVYSKPCYYDVPPPEAEEAKAK